MKYRTNKPPYFGDPLELIPKAISKAYSIWVSLIYPFASKGRKFTIHFTSQLSRRQAPRISLGHSVVMRKGAWLNVADDNCTGEPAILIGDECCLGADSIISAKNKIHIERDVLVSQSVLIQDHNHAYEDITEPIVDQGITKGGRIRIGEGCWIGHGAAIICSRGDLTIGRNCVIGANSVVLRSIPPYSVVSGIPAMIIRRYDPVRRAWCLGSKVSVAPQNSESAASFSSADRRAELMGKS